GSTSGLVGNPAPDFSVQAVAGGKSTVSLKSLRGKVVLVDFWGTFCEPCKQSFPKLQDLHTKYGSSGLRIVGISEDDADSKGEIPAFCKLSGSQVHAWMGRGQVDRSLVQTPDDAVLIPDRQERRRPLRPR